MHGLSGLETVAHTHVDDFSIAFKKASKTYKNAMKHFVHELHLENREARSCIVDGPSPGMAITSEYLKPSQRCWKAHLPALRSLDTEVCWDSCCGWDSNRDLIDVGVSLAAQKLSKATLSDVKTLNKLIDQAKSTAYLSIVIPCGVANLETCSIVCYADAGFANADGETSQCGLVVGLTHHLELVKTGRFDLSTVTSW